MYDFANWKPVIAAVHGYVLGAGVYLALASEMIVGHADGSADIVVIGAPRS